MMISKLRMSNFKTHSSSDLVDILDFIQRQFSRNLFLESWSDSWEDLDTEI